MCRSTILAIFLACLAVTCHASRDGVPGSRQSEGSIRISLSILPSVQISVVNQINIDIDNIYIDTNFTERVCITGQPGNRYRLTATGDAGEFALRGADDNTLPYSVSYNGDPNVTTFDELTAGVPSRVYNVLPSTEQCETLGYNFKVTFKSKDLVSVQSGLYSGALTLLVSPL